jgi:hypothetical protein
MSVILPPETGNYLFLPPCRSVKTGFFLQQTDSWRAIANIETGSFKFFTFAFPHVAEYARLTAWFHHLPILVP